MPRNTRNVTRGNASTTSTKIGTTGGGQYNPNPQAGAPDTTPKVGAPSPFAGNGGAMNPAFASGARQPGWDLSLQDINAMLQQFGATASFGPDGLVLTGPNGQTYVNQGSSHEGAGPGGQSAFLESLMGMQGKQHYGGALAQLDQALAGVAQKGRFARSIGMDPNASMADISAHNRAAGATPIPQSTMDGASPAARAWLQAHPNNQAAPAQPTLPDDTGFHPPATTPPTPVPPERPIFGPPGPPQTVPPEGVRPPFGPPGPPQQVNDPFRVPGQTGPPSIVPAAAATPAPPSPASALTTTGRVAPASSTAAQAAGATAGQKALGATSLNFPQGKGGQAPPNPFGVTTPKPQTMSPFQASGRRTY